MGICFGREWDIAVGGPLVFGIKGFLTVCFPIKYRRNLDLFYSGGEFNLGGWSRRRAELFYRR